MSKRIKYPNMISVRVDNMILEAVKDLATQHNCHESDVLRKAIRSYLVKVDALKHQDSYMLMFP